MIPTILFIWTGFLLAWACALAVWLYWLLKERKAVRLRERRYRDVIRQLPPEQEDKAP